MRILIHSFVLIFSMINMALAKAPEPFKPSVCAISNASPLLSGAKMNCTAYEGKVGAMYYAEYSYMNKGDYFIFIITQLSGVNTCFPNINNFKKKLSSFSWIKDQKPKYKRSKEKALKIGFWGNYAKSYNARMDSFSGSCFAIYAAGGGSDDANKRSHALYALICKENRKAFPLDERISISENFKIRHKFFKG